MIPILKIACFIDIAKDFLATPYSCAPLFLSPLGLGFSDAGISTWKRTLTPLAQTDKKNPINVLQTQTNENKCPLIYFVVPSQYILMLYLGRQVFLKKKKLAFMVTVVVRKAAQVRDLEVREGESGWGGRREGENPSPHLGGRIHGTRNV